MLPVEDAPAGSKLAEVPIINARLPTGVKTDNPPLLIVAAAGPYLKNVSGHQASCLTFCQKFDVARLVRSLQHNNLKIVMSFAASPFPK